MKIFLSEIKEIESEFDFSSKEEPWLTAAVTKLDEKAEFDRESLSPSAKSRPRDVEAHLVMNKVDGVVVVNGRITTKVKLLCSRCANPFYLDCNSKFMSLFSKDPDMAGIPQLQQGSDRKPKSVRGKAKSAHDANEQDLDITYLTEDFIDVSDMVTEQVQLQIPFQPLCEESCKGMCANCGADLNVGRCACEKLLPQNPFSALKNLKLNH